VQPAPTTHVDRRPQPAGVRTEASGDRTCGMISRSEVSGKPGQAQFRAWSELVQSAIQAESGLASRLWPTFPGFEAAFGCVWPIEPTRTTELDEAELDFDVRDKDPNKRAAKVVERYLRGIELVQQRDETVDVVVCVVPDIVYQN